MFTVGITGGIATGKSTATDFFTKKGIDIIFATMRIGSHR